MFSRTSAGNHSEFHIPPVFCPNVLPPPLNGFAVAVPPKPVEAVVLEPKASEGNCISSRSSQGVDRSMKQKLLCLPGVVLLVLPNPPNPPVEVVLFCPVPPNEKPPPPNAMSAAKRESKCGVLLESRVYSCGRALRMQKGKCKSPTGGRYSIKYYRLK